MKSINQLLGSKLLKKASHLAKLTRVLKASLPADYRDHVQVAGLHDGQLILLTDSPVWASRLRLYTQNIIQMLEEHAHIKVQNIRIRQSQPRHIPEPPVKKHRHLTKESARTISQTADSITDPALQQALYNLAKNQQEGEDQ